MMSMSPDPLGHHNNEPMTMGTPTSPTSPANHSQYLPGFLLGDSMSYPASPVTSRLWSGSGGSPPRASHRGSSLTSPNTSHTQQHFSTPRMESSIRGKDKAGAPPIRSLLQSSSPAHSVTNSLFSTPSQYPSSSAGLSTPAPPTVGLSTSHQEYGLYSPDQSSITSSRIPTSPAQLDPFYTQGLTCRVIWIKMSMLARGKPYVCKVCDKIFTKSSNLKQHMLVHTGERLFKCRLCDKGFTQSCTLKRHMVFHTQDKPFKCQLCNKGFNQSDDLQSHMLVHTGDIPFKCEICDKGFTRSNSHNRHMLVHTGDRSFKCEICNKYFSQSAHLRRHTLTHKMV